MLEPHHILLAVIISQSISVVLLLLYCRGYCVIVLTTEVGEHMGRWDICFNSVTCKKNNIIRG